MKKNVLVTGGNKGIGLEVTKLFLQKNYNVIVIARDFSNFEISQESNLKTISFNLVNIDLIPDLIKELGRIDILINNAGIMNSIPFDSYPRNRMEEIVKINLEAPVTLINEVSKCMIENKSGRIVNVASLAGETGHPDIWYGITKAGLINATKSYSAILGPLGIVINAVAPGPTKTEMLKVIPEKRKSTIKSNVYLNRFAEAKEIADTIFWLATDSPEYINGICIDINNGALLR